MSTYPGGTMIRCDGCCDATLHAGTIREVRSFARQQHGWTCYRDGVDLCPKCQILRAGIAVWVVLVGTGHRPAPAAQQPSELCGWTFLCGLSSGELGDVVSNGDERPKRCCRACEAEHDRRRLIAEIKGGAR